ncbi:Conserved_hypothetical protein [Hexamita inflata]|uniref:Uncharacterized protein n=1 Tax=Hexamita inflata TaxID=28002 RepID=A0AA86RHL5_9EUKA|nr:Conserved hypothetical protein [Hexamita inflata]
MTEQNQNSLNEEYDAKMTRKYEGKIKNGKLEIGDMFSEDPEVTNLRFLEKINIQTLELYISSDMNVKLRSKTLKELSVFQCMDEHGQLQFRLHLNVDDSELENLEYLNLQQNSLKNDQLYNLAKFKKLHTLDISQNKVDLTHIHSVISLTKLYMPGCGLRNVDQISSLINLEDLDISSNSDIDLSPLYQLKSLTKLTMRNCGLTNIDQITQLITVVGPRNAFLNQEEE